MFFILSKVIGLLLRPSIWVIALLVYSRFTKFPNRRRFATRWGWVFLLILTNPLLYNQANKMWIIEPVPVASLPPEGFDIGIVLGGFSSPEALPDDRLHFNQDADRLTQALELYATKHIRKLLITTGSARVMGEKYNEADNVKAFLLRLHVPEEDIILESASRNTHENAAFTAKLLREQYPQATCLLITSPFHLRRGMACFRKEGVQVTPFAAGSYGEKGKSSLVGLVQDLTPNPAILVHWDTLVKEWFGMLAYWIKGYI